MAATCGILAMFFAISLLIEHEAIHLLSIPGKTIFDILKSSYFPVGNYMFKVNNRNTRTRWEMCSELTLKAQINAGWVVVDFY